MGLAAILVTQIRRMSATRGGTCARAEPGRLVADSYRHSANVGKVLSKTNGAGLEILAFEQSPTHQEQTGDHHRDAPVPRQQILVVEVAEDPRKGYE